MIYCSIEDNTEGSVKNNADAFIFHTAICAEAPQIAYEPAVRYALEQKKNKIHSLLRCFLLVRPPLMLRNGG